MKVLIIDGQGGKMGALLVKGIKERCPGQDIYCIGTNGIATAAMLKAGGDFGATGENPVVVNSADADVIAGPIGIIVADAILGEVTAKMAAAVGACRAEKVLIPVQSCSVHVAGIAENTMAGYVRDAIDRICGLIQN